jgi:hypothetical protein
MRCECQRHPECCGNIADYCEATYPSRFDPNSVLQTEPYWFRLDNFIYKQFEQRQRVKNG